MITAIVFLLFALVCIIWAKRESDRINNIIIKSLEERLSHETEYWKSVVKIVEYNAARCEFIHGDKETGSVWVMDFKKEKNIGIGDVIKLDSMDGDRFYSIHRFNGITNGCISFYVSEVNFNVIINK